MKGAGTNANVKLRILGSLDGRSCKLPETEDLFTLDNALDNFERGKLDTFILDKQPRMDALTHVVISHDSSGVFSGWHLDWVEVTIGGGETYYFKCGVWIDQSNKALGGKAEVCFTSLQ